jgi:uncharacterized pyridoxal phosphate-containing UPF0001 family protein
VPALIDAIQTCPNLKLTGLMTMPPWSDDPEATRPYFRRLSEIGPAFRIEETVDGHVARSRSAIEEGATHVRVGTALFGPRRKD